MWWNSYYKIKSQDGNHKNSTGQPPFLNTITYKIIPSRMKSITTTIKYLRRVLICFICFTKMMENNVKLWDPSLSAFPFLLFYKRILGKEMYILFSALLSGANYNPFSESAMLASIWAKPRKEFPFSTLMLSNPEAKNNIMNIGHAVPAALLIQWWKVLWS